MTKVIVIGSGVAGAATAFALARRGASVTVVDSGDDGQATAAGAGIVQPWSTGTTGPMYRLYAAGAAYYPTAVALLAEAGVADIGYRRTGSLVVSEDTAQLRTIADRVRARTVDEPVAGEVSLLDSREAQRLFPPLAPGLGAVHVGGGARVDGRALRQGLLDAARRHGAELVSGRAALEPGSGEATRALVDGEPLPGDAVVVAAGAWTGFLLAPLGCAMPVRPQRGQITHLVLAGAETGGWPTALPDTGHYLVPFEDGRIAVGATRESDSGFDPRVTAAGLHSVLSHALAVAPGLSEAGVLETRVGLRPLAERPLVGPVPGRPGVFVVTGFGAGGLTMGPVAGEELACVVLGGESDLLAEVGLPDA